MDKFRIFIYIFSLVSLVYSKHEIYNGHILYKIKVQDIEQAKLVNELENLIPIDVLSHAIPERNGEILVKKETKQEFENALNDAAIEFEIETENVKELLDYEEKLHEEASRSSYNRSWPLSYDRIHDYAAVDNYLQWLANKYSSVVSLITAGRSFEGRPIKYLKISRSNFQDAKKPIVYMQSLLHAREWITLPATLYAIEKLVIDVQDQDLIQGLDWIILPIANPDGFEFTRQSRFWRKNRATGYFPNNSCIGVDLNRNFDINWSQYSSHFTCMETFHGRSPFSEPEAAIIRNINLKHQNRIKLFLDIHSFGSMILYGYGSGVLPPNDWVIHSIGTRMSSAIDAVKTPWNPNYIVGNVAAVLYQASGSAADYAQAIGIPFSYTYELPGYRFGSGTTGFLVDPNFIEQAGFETWEGIKVGARSVLRILSMR